MWSNKKCMDEFKFKKESHKGWQNKHKDMFLMVQIHISIQQKKEGCQGSVENYEIKRKKIKPCKVPFKTTHID